jgi:hypothetical protein
MAGPEGFPDDRDEHQMRGWATPIVSRAYILVLGHDELVNEELIGEEMFDQMAQQRTAIAHDPRVVEAAKELQIYTEEAVIAIAKLSRGIQEFENSEKAARSDWGKRVLAERRSAELELAVSGTPDDISELE